MLTEKQKRHLRGLGHGLKPVVLVGNAGFTPAVARELDAALLRHELVKVRISAAGRDQKSRIIQALCETCGAEPVQRIGHVALLFRRNVEQPRLELP
ncbi:MAG TPA: ribosome assembly RNA-binding protein YhbY [Gammaproteobacteria bacterium]|nr:ribosome assembly RNA-binding protein YhbY [Gammaproteobacteria bacterium]